jgi:hypothetical protein
VVTFDDHEVDNDFAGDIPQDPARQPHDAFVARLTAAYQAYYEHMPVRATAVPDGPHIRMYRRLDFGWLARLNVLDTRQYRSDQFGACYSCRMSVSGVVEDQVHSLVLRVAWSACGPILPMCPPGTVGGGSVGLAADAVTVPVKAVRVVGADPDGT